MTRGISALRIQDPDLNHTAEVSMQLGLLKLICLGLVLMTLAGGAQAKDDSVLVPFIRSVQDGAWSSPQTWEGGNVPFDGNFVQIRPGHTVTYDLPKSPVFRAVH